MLGFVFSLLASMVGMFFVVEASYIREEQQRRLARVTHLLSALAFIVGVLVAIIAAMYVRLTMGFWVWLVLLALYFGLMAILVTRFRGATTGIVTALADSMIVLREVLAVIPTLLAGSVTVLRDALTVFPTVLAASAAGLSDVFKGFIAWLARIIRRR